jgi:hypothetical protein
MKKFKKKDRKKKTDSTVEKEYLKKLEDAIKGKNGLSPYIQSPQELKKQEQLRRLREGHVKPDRPAPPEKEPPRIPIEWAINHECDSPQPEVEATAQSLPIEEVFQKPEPVSQDVQEPSPEISKPVPKPTLEKKKVVAPTLPPTKQLYDIGSIIRLEDGSIGIYKGPIPGKEYHLVYHLRPDGSIRPEGIYLYAYRSEQLGCVTPEVLDDIQRSMRWERERIVHHLSSSEKSRLIPLLSPQAIKEEVSAPIRKKESLERGRHLLIKIGNRLWDAIYWGSDELGQIVAHNTNKVWTLMHLNLGRFGDSLEYGDLISPEEIKEINDSLSQRLSVGD